jgi:hypothetical protein
MEKSKLAQHGYKEGHTIGWEEVKILQIETNIIYRKLKEYAHMACMTNPISQSRLELSIILIPLINKEADRS